VEFVILGIYHAFQSAQPDPANTPANQLRAWPSDWNKDHFHPDFALMTITCRGVAMTGYAIASGVIEFLGLTIHRARFDLSYVDQIRLIANVVQPGSQNAALLAQWSGDGGATWNNFAGGGAQAPTVSVFRRGCVQSGWLNTSAASRAAGDALIRLATMGGDGLTAVKFGTIALQVY
jgi:hypothetical protein